MQGFQCQADDFTSRATASQGGLARLEVGGCKAGTLIDNSIISALGVRSKHLTLPLLTSMATLGPF